MVPERPPMPSETDALLRSIRRWLLVAAFVLGLGLVALSDVGYLVSGYEDGPIFASTGVAGGVVALVAAGKWLSSFASKPEAAEDG